MVIYPNSTCTIALKILYKTQSEVGIALTMHVQGPGSSTYACKIAGEGQAEWCMPCDAEAGGPELEASLDYTVRPLCQKEKNECKMLR